MGDPYKDGEREGGGAEEGGERRVMTKKGKVGFESNCVLVFTKEKGYPG